MVRDIEPDDRNPFTTKQTVEMIETYHKSVNDDVKVIVIPDIESVNYGRGVGYEINEYEPPSDSGAMFISATKLENLFEMEMKLGKKWLIAQFILVLKKFLN